MKKADTLTGQITRKVTAAKAGVAEVSANAASNKSAGHDHVDAINQVFAELELAYHNQYHKAFADKESLGVAKKYWLQCLGHFSPELILKATRKVVTSQQFLPSIATLVQACEEAMSLYGLPPARDAYVEACCAKHPKAEQSWTHPAVYLAGKESGWFDLENQIEAQAFPLYEQHYKKLCQRVLHGEELKIEIPEALPEQSSKKLSLEDNKSRMDELRNHLKT